MVDFFPFKAVRGDDKSSRNEGMPSKSVAKKHLYGSSKFTRDYLLRSSRFYSEISLSGFERPRPPLLSISSGKFKNFSREKLSNGVKNLSNLKKKKN